MHFLNMQHPSENIWTGGQPSEEELRAARGHGVEFVINLRPESEDAGYDESLVAKELDINYSVIGISGAADLTRDNVDKLDDLLLVADRRPTIIHCASGNRVGALMALRAAWRYGKSVEEALEIGREHGLTKMEPMIAEILKS